LNAEVLAKFDARNRHGSSRRSSLSIPKKISKRISPQKSLRMDLSKINGQTRWELSVLEKSNDAPF